MTPLCIYIVSALLVAIAAVIESFHKYGSGWRTNWLEKLIVTFIPIVNTVFAVVCIMLVFGCCLEGDSK